MGQGYDLPLDQLQRHKICQRKDHSREEAKYISHHWDNEIIAPECAPIISQSILSNHRELPDAVERLKKTFGITFTPILRVANTTTGDIGTPTSVLAKPEDEDKKKIAELGLDRIIIFFACRKDITLKHSNSSFNEGIFKPQLTPIFDEIIKGRAK